MILVFAMLSVIMVTAVVVLIVSIRTGNSPILLEKHYSTSQRDSYNSFVPMLRKYQRGVIVR